MNSTPVSLPTRMKSYEQVETLLKFDKTKTLYIRVDGRSFSNFTRGMAEEDTMKSIKPVENGFKVDETTLVIPADDQATITMVPKFSLKFSDAMQQTAQYLLNETNATLAYVQSDEISLVFKPVEADSKTELFFAGKKQKIVSTIASLATAGFLSIALEYWPERVAKRGLPTFDCRALELPNEAEVANTITWRCRDGTRNSISTICRAFRSAKQLDKVNTQDMLKIITDHGIEFDSLPRHFREGTFYKRVSVEKEISSQLGEPFTVQRHVITEVIPDVMFASLPFEEKMAVIFG